MAKQFNTFTGSQKGITYVGSKGYAYSGVLSVDNTVTTLLEFKTELDKSLIGKLIVAYDSESADNMEFVLLYNNVKVYIVTIGDRAEGTPFTPIDIIIPPSTVCIVTCANIDNTNSRDMLCHIVGSIK
jgi:hypothetical protein